MTVPPGQKTVAILGGGISGLSVAYYLRKKYGDLMRPVIFEQTKRTGGWIRSILSEGNIFETGPRTVRPVGLAGLNALDLIEDIGLDKNVVYVPSDHPGARNKFIFTKGKLVKLPSEKLVLFHKMPPLERPLYKAFLRDIFKRRVKDDDDSIHDFATRRFGTDIADYLVDPLIRGICAGEAREISVKFLMRQWYYYEQKYGSVILGMIFDKIFKKPSQTESLYQIPGYESIGFSKLALTSLQHKWSLWSLEDGLESLPKTLEKKLTSEMDTKIIFNATIKLIKFSEDEDEDKKVPSSNNVEIHYHKHRDERKVEKFKCDYVISTIPAWKFSKILRKSKPSHPSLWQLLNLICATDVIVTNIVYKNCLELLDYDAFGFLVPSNEVEITPTVEGLLGIVFDTCCIGQGNDTVLTIMSYPTKEIRQSGSRAAAIKLVKKLTRLYLATTLNIDKEPDDYVITLSKDCIPQFNVGHYEKVDGIRMFIKAAKLPLAICGASYDGISVNDCIFSARRVIEALPFTDLLQDQSL